MVEVKYAVHTNYCKVFWCFPTKSVEMGNDKDWCPATKDVEGLNDKDW